MNNYLLVIKYKEKDSVREKSIEIDSAENRDIFLQHLKNYNRGYKILEDSGLNEAQINNIGGITEYLKKNKELIAAIYHFNVYDILPINEYLFSENSEFIFCEIESAIYYNLRDRICVI